MPEGIEPNTLIKRGIRVEPYKRWLRELSEDQIEFLLLTQKMEILK